MIIRVKNRHLRIELKRVQTLAGLNSILPSGKHLTLFDIDDMDSEAMEASLRSTQDFYLLPDITVFGSGTENHWLAFCRTERPQLKVAEYLMNTVGIDLAFVGIGLARGRWTIRLSEKNGKIPFPYKVLKPRYYKMKNEADLATWSLAKYEAVI